VLLYELTHAPLEKDLLEKTLKRRLKIPKAIAEAPVLLAGLEVFYRAFWDLINDRPTPDSMIPWYPVQLWADRHHLDSIASDDLHFFLRRMDMEFIKWAQKKSKAKAG
jgi:hypothetical protein